MNNLAALRLAPQDKVVLHSQFADYMAGKRIYPVNIEISCSGLCNASCDFCFFANTGELGHHRNVMLETPRLMHLIGECFELKIKSISWTGGGEPSLHPDFAPIVSLTHSMGIEQGIFTNALAKPKYDASRMEWVRVTMTDKPYRIDCIDPLRAAKVLGFAFNYSGPQDDAYLMETLQVAESVGADYVQLRPALKFHGQTVDIDPPKIEHPLLHVTEYKFEEAKKRHGYSTCEAYHLSPMVWEDGNVDTCAYMRLHDGYTLGNLYKSTLKEILDAAPPHVPVHEQCQVCCRLHESNKLIHASRQLQDVNFP